MNVLSDFSSGEWSKNTLKCLEDHASMREYCDMFWELNDGTLVPDVRGVYMRFSEPLASSTGTERVVKVSGYMAAPELFHMIRVYCHTGQIMYGKAESPRALLKRYECVHFYNIPCSKRLFQKLIVDRLDVYSAMQLFEILATKDYNDDALLKEVCMYVKMHFGEAGKTALHQVSGIALPHICNMMSQEDANISEGKLMGQLYAVCSKVNSSSPTQLFVSPQGDRTNSPWQCVRILGLSVEDILSFRKNWPNAFQDTFYMSLIEVIKSGSAAPEQMHQLGLSEQSFLSPRKMRPISCYPRNLPIGTGTTVHTMWEDENLSITYASIAYQRGLHVELPPFTSGGAVLQLTAHFQGEHLNIAGGMNMNLSREASQCQQRTLTLYLVNFRHGRWNKRSVVVEGNLFFRVDKLITLNALENEGYRFDSTKYPDFAPGNMILMKVVVATSDTQVEQ
ncbi:hypothetical protein JKP88DRAFT_241068 [Tribonema minus]|uniref:Uncharacterized protein n=1 Tax=Tribonema minus TaxID=303371 RepID=A0A836CH79_9STRA|nr:hypothetical protein JKP88DRAFT_241068 [Tribonema minus]